MRVKKDRQIKIKVEVKFWFLSLTGRPRGAVRSRKLKMKTFPKIETLKFLILFKEIQELSYFCRKVLKSDGNAVDLSDLFMIEICPSTLNRDDLNAITYSYVFLYNRATLPNRHSVGFLETVLQCMELAKASGSHPSQFVPHFDSQLTNIESHYYKQFAVISNIT